MKSKNIVSFISNVVNNNYKKADAALAAIVNEKIRQRIFAADRKLSKQDK